jgi:hypothetical protein
MDDTCSSQGRHEKYKKILVRKPKGKYHLRYLCVDGRIILKWILEKYSVRMWTGCMWLRVGPMAGPPGYDK